MREGSLLLFLAGGAAGAVAACAALQYMQRRSWNPASRQYDDTSAIHERSGAPTVPRTVTGLHNFLEDEVLAEQFTRNVQFFGREGQLKIADAFVIVIGLGVSING